MTASIMDIVRAELERLGVPDTARVRLDGVDLIDATDVQVRVNDGVYEVVVDDRPVANVKVSVLLPPTARDVWITFNKGMPEL